MFVSQIMPIDDVELFFVVSEGLSVGQGELFLLKGGVWIESCIDVSVLKRVCLGHDFVQRDLSIT